MFKRVIAMLFAVIIISCSCFMPAVASNREDSDFKDALQVFLSHRGFVGEPSDEICSTWSYLVSALRDNGLTDVAIAGILGNVIHESFGTPYAVEGYEGVRAVTKEGVSKTYREFVAGDVVMYPRGYYPQQTFTNEEHTAGSSGNGHGIIQWSYDRADRLTEFCEGKLEVPFPSGSGYVTVYHNEWNSSRTQSYSYVERKIPDLAGQVVFLLWELQYGYNNYYTQWFNKMQSTDSVKTACEIFRVHVEVGGQNSKESRWEAAEKAFKMLEVCPVIDCGKLDDVPMSVRLLGCELFGDSINNADVLQELQETSVYCYIPEGVNKEHGDFISAFGDVVGALLTMYVVFAYVCFPDSNIQINDMNLSRIRVLRLNSCKSLVNIKVQFRKTPLQRG